MVFRFMVCGGTPDWQPIWSCQDSSGSPCWPKDCSTVPLPMGRMSICNNQFLHIVAWMLMSWFVRTIEGDDVCREWDSNKTMDYLVEEDQSWVSTPLFESAPDQSSQHVWNTRVGRVITQDPSSRPSLDHLDPLDIFLDMRVPDWCSIFQLGANNSLISYLPKFWP